MSVTIMIIEDEDQMRQLVKTFLLKEGYSVLEASNGIDALSKIKHNIPDLLLVDVMMPYMDGFTFANEVKKTHDIPLIFLTAKGEEWDKIHGLKLGGDDYIVKPFHPGELLARIESVLRRAKVATTPASRKAIGPLTLDVESHSATINGQSLSLTLKEYELLLLLATNNGKVFSREQLLQSIWGYSYTGSERTVDTHIKTLRLKLKQHGTLIQTVWGKGYKVRLP
ncbi:response regulator transcription factor [Metabacillus halosaccharovorans]|uniref:response regulator transcription factor n=1 Tax=Metabacillus halosaccharovorans TaxID=930124 RepID=UPI001C200FAE|nr:response regulator transcription factor [Metabacillus halosaccharovorans]MBU7595149.1 response regulator transcription factor [Metabacillus halosaccharovorans]